MSTCRFIFFPGSSPLSYFGTPVGNLQQCRFTRYCISGRNIRTTKNKNPLYQKKRGLQNPWLENIGNYKMHSYKTFTVDTNPAISYNVLLEILKNANEN